MKAVDILTNARDRFLANRLNWTTGQLAHKRKGADEGKCFCSIGGVLNAGGGYNDKLELVTDRIRQDGRLSHGTTKYDCAVRLDGALFCTYESQREEAVSTIDVLKEELAKEGFAAKQTITALTYLQAAARQVGNADVVSINDSSKSNNNFERVITMFNVAIKNAKRRHVNGQRYAKAVSP